MRSKLAIGAWLAMAVVALGWPEQAKAEQAKVAEIGFHSASRPCADIVVTLPQQHAPSFRALLPEEVTGCPLPGKGFFHTEPGFEWKKGDRGSWSGTIEIEDFGRIQISLVPRDYYVEITWTLENLSAKPLKKTSLNFCFNVNNAGSGGRSWANREFLPKSRLNREEDGEFWHDRVAHKGAYVHSAGRWINEPTAALDASILVIANQAGNRYAFQMWDKPVPSTWINTGNACMHLKPVLCDSLGVGETAVMRGRMGISPKGLEPIWRLYQGLTQISGQATANEKAQHGAPADADPQRR